MRRILATLVFGVLALPSCSGNPAPGNPCDLLPELPGCEPAPPGGSDGFDCDTALESTARALAATGQIPFTPSPTGRYIVTVRTGMRTLQSFAAEYEVEDFTPLGSGFAGTMSEARARELASSPAVLRVEPDGIKSIPPGEDQGPQASTRLWGLDRIDARSGLDGDYSPNGTGAGVHVCVIDTGITEHEDFRGRVGEGFSSVGGTPEDGHYHGTHVAGTIGGNQFGVAKEVILHPIRVLNSQGQGTDSQVIQGIEACQNMREENGWPMVANMSLGGSPSDALDTALCRLIQSGVFVAVAAGNDDLGACSYSPARVVQAITAMASDDRDAKASFSNTGPCGDCWAPGVDIISANKGGGERTLSGTSMASPHLAGAAALILGAHPDWTPAQVFTELVGRATPDVIRFGDTPSELVYVGRE